MKLRTLAVLLLATVGLARQAAAQSSAAPVAKAAPKPERDRTKEAAVSKAGDAEAAPVDVQADETTSVAVMVTDSSGDSVFLDHGSDDGIFIGNRVLLYSRTQGILAGTIRAATRKSCNCTLDAGPVAVEVGTKGEVLVPKRPPSTPAPGERPARPEHPPWTAPPSDWNTDQPLLRPAFSRSASERPAELTGYSFARGSYSTNQLGTSNRYLQAEIGGDASLLNVVPGEGILRIRAEYFYQSATLANSPATTENDARVDWFSVVWGGLQQGSARAEIGRFLQHEFSELGELDGGEAALKIGDHLHLGASVGAMPDYRRRVEATGDYQAAGFAKFLSSAKEEFSLGAAYQKTIHDGIWDRDLIVAVTDFVPSQWFSARASAWIDYYTSSEQVKSQGFELTEAHAYASYRFDVDNNVGLFFTRSRRPDVLRDELFQQGQQPTPQEAELLRENLSLYYGAYSWHRLAQNVVADTRFSLWSDETHKHGLSGEAHVGFQDLLFEKGEIGITGFYTDGIYTRGPGARLTVSHLMAPVSVIGWYEAAWYENVTDGTSALQNSVHLSVDTGLSDTWSFSLSADYRFGFQQDSFTFTLSIMKRLR